MNRNAPITLLLRLEGLALALVSVWLYAGIHESWWLFAVLLLAPTLPSGLPRRATDWAIVYNSVHSWIAPVVLFAIGWWGNAGFLLPVAFALGAHIGFDRALGYGLKLPDSFKNTHLGRIGRARAEGSGG
jgi:hypothetical protein